MKITPDIIAGVRGAVDYYGNVLQLSKELGIAHSTVHFWLNGRTSNISGVLWKNKIRPILEPFMPKEQESVLREAGGVYQVTPPRPQAMDTVPRIGMEALTELDPSIEPIDIFLLENSTDRQAFSAENLPSWFAATVDDAHAGYFRAGSNLLVTPTELLRSGDYVILRLRSTGEVLLRLYLRDGNEMRLIPLPDERGKEITWNRQHSPGYLLWMYPIQQACLTFRVPSEERMPPREVVIVKSKPIEKKRRCRPHSRRA